MTSSSLSSDTFVLRLRVRGPQKDPATSMATKASSFFLKTRLTRSGQSRGLQLAGSISTSSVHRGFMVKVTKARGLPLFRTTDMAFAVCSARKRGPPWKDLWR